MKRGLANFGIDAGDSVPPGTCAKMRGQTLNLLVRYAPAPATDPAHRNLRRVVMSFLST